MKTYNEYIEMAIQKKACPNGIEYAKQFKELKEFLNSYNREFVEWFIRNINDEPQNLLLIEDKNYAIQTASQNGHTEIVKLLLADKRVDPSADDNWAIKRASRNGHIKVVKLLLQHPKVKSSLSKEDIKK
jgi:ankyrin repeat protein